MASNEQFSSERLRLYFAALLVDAATYGYFLLIAQDAQRRFEATPDTLGYLGTVVTIILAASSLLSGRLSDRFGSERVYGLGIACVTLAAVPIAYQADGLLPMFFANGLFGMGLGLFWPPLERRLSLLVVRETGSQDPLWRAVGTFNCFWAAGIALASAVAPRAHSKYGVGACLSGVFVALVAAGVLLVIPKRRRTVSTTSREHRPEEVSAQTALFFSLAWVGNLGGYFVFQSLYHVFPYTQAALGFSNAQLGNMLLLVGAARFAVFFLFRLFDGWRYSLLWLVGAELVTAVSLVVLSVSADVWVFLVLLPTVGALCGVTAFSSLSYGLEAPSAVGRKSGLHEAMQAVGKATGPLACGWVAAGTPKWPGSMLACGAAALLVVAAAQFFVWRRRATFSNGLDRVSSRPGP